MSDEETDWSDDDNLTRAMFQDDLWDLSWDATVLSHIISDFCSVLERGGCEAEWDEITAYVANCKAQLANIILNCPVDSVSRYDYMICNELPKK